MEFFRRKLPEPMHLAGRCGKDAPMGAGRVGANVGMNAMQRIGKCSRLERKDDHYA